MEPVPCFSGKTRQICLEKLEFVWKNQTKKGLFPVFRAVAFAAKSDNQESALARDVADREMCLNVFFASIKKEYGVER
ncbi:MAG: hypothetical protein SVS15_03205 [Thermodesulfobacteriota bacterium]|nr:hypothetical protein [Thermodesulfobacteriota bacterium]